jgi:cobalt-zinc-cadmium efflux system membrane fusion protein
MSLGHTGPESAAPSVRAGQPEGPEPSVPPGKARITARLARVLPNLLVLAALGGLAVWGHQTGWTVPKFTSLWGAPTAGKEDWCEAHGVPESACVECDPGLLPRPTAFGWCDVHGVSECPLDHPEVAQLASPRGVSAADFERARRALALVERPENNRKCPLLKRRLQFVSAEARDKAGIDVRPAAVGRVVESIAANGEVTYDQTRLARLSSLVPGRLWRVDKAIGKRVKKGDLLALVEAAEVGKAKAEFLQALVQVEVRGKLADSMRPLVPGGALPAMRLQETEASLQEAQVHLAASQQALINLGLPVQHEAFRGLSSAESARRIQFLGLPADAIRTLDPLTTTASLLPLIAPFDGEVVARDAVAGEVVDPTRVLFIVADVSRMWLMLDVRQQDLGLLALGQDVGFRPGGRKDEAVGKLAWISTAVDQKTRTAKVRANLDNADGRLPAHLFGGGRVALRVEDRAVVVPSEAIQWDGDCHLVFVQDKDFHRESAPKVFHVRQVRPGVHNELQGTTEVIAGLLPGEVVATKGSDVLRAELLKSSLGEG